MALNPGGTGNHNWNYSNPQREGYSTQLVGTVLAIQEVQKMQYNPYGSGPGKPDFWPDGNPKMNIRMALATPEGELKTFTFPPASKAARMGQKRSVHMDLFHLTGDTDMLNLVGKTICITTQEGRYGQGNPRPWTVQLVEGGPFKLSSPLPNEFKVPQVLANSATSGGQVVQQQQPQPQYHPQPQAYQPQQYQPAPQPQPMYQPMPQPQYQQPTMDPQIMQAMASQAFGGPVSVEQMQPQPTDQVGSGEVYEDEMPF